METHNWKYREGDIIALHPSRPQLVLATELVQLQDPTDQETKYRDFPTYTLLDMLEGHIYRDDAPAIDKALHPIDRWAGAAGGGGVTL